MKFIDTLKSGLIKVLSREEDFSQILHQELGQVLSKMQTSGLGDRTQYVGASDIGKCMRAAALSKQQKAPLSLQQAIYFMRGHLAEMIVMLALKAENFAFHYQPEFVHPEKKYIKAHVDFASMNFERVHILEVKSGPIRTNIDFWKDQLYTQMGLAKKNYPDKKATGSILNIDLTAGEIRYFNGYEHDPEEYERCESRADQLWEIMQKPGTEDDHCEKGFLCADWCDFLPTCPVFTGEGYPQMPVLAEDFNDWNEAKTEAKTVKKLYESQNDYLLELLKAIGRRVSTGEHVVWAQKKSRSGGVDWKKLEKEKPDIYRLVKADYMKNPTEFFQVESFEIQNETADAEQAAA